ncbi:MAG: hypothetical protein U1E45_11895 [Geminicoccaceae bacterium]
MRFTVVTFTAAAVLVFVSAGAQQYMPTDPPANPQKVVPDQHLEVINEKLITANHVLQEAASTPSRTDKAIAYGHTAVQAVRDALDRLPQEQQMTYEKAILQAEQALASNDPAASADAITELRNEVLRIAQRGG